MNWHRAFAIKRSPTRMRAFSSLADKQQKNTMPARKAAHEPRISSAELQSGVKEFMNRATRSSEPLYVWATSSLVITVIMLLTFGSNQGHATTSARTAKAVEGDEIFHKRCVGCHNKQAGDTTPFGPPNLHGIFAAKVITTKDAATIIAEGKGTMPAFGKDLSNAQIQAVIAYLKTQ